MWWRSSRLDRIEENMDRMQQHMQHMQQQLDLTERNINRLAEISEATNLRIDRLADKMDGFVEEMRDRTEQL
jgi:DNA anti-recombination protein RmuC